MINYFYTLSIIMSLQDKTLYFLMSGYLTQPVFCVNMFEYHLISGVSNQLFRSLTPQYFFLWVLEKHFPISTPLHSSNMYENL